MFKKFLVMGALIIISLSFFSGCDKENYLDVAYEGEGGFGLRPVNNAGESFPASVIVNSLQELKDLCEEWENPAFQENSEHYSSILSTKIREYDEVFFESNSVVILQFSGGNTANGYSHYIKSLTVENEVLVIERHDVRKRGTWDDYAVLRLILLEVEKQDISTVTSIQVNAIHK